MTAAALFGTDALAADTQPYSVQLTATGDADLDSTLGYSSQLLTLRTSPPPSPFALIARARGDVERLRTVLRSFGYYQGRVVVIIDGLAIDDSHLAQLLAARPPGTPARCTITVAPGALYHLGTIQIDAPIDDAARRALGLPAGMPAVAAAVLIGVARLQAALENQGFAFAKVERPVAYENPDSRTLDLSIHVVPGPKVRIGELRTEGLGRVRKGTVLARLRLRSGDLYSAREVEAARKDLLGLGVFAAVDVRLATAPDSLGRISVTFVMTERRRHAVSVTAAYSSDLGGSGGVIWSDRNVFGGAQQLDLSASAINVGGDDATGLGYDLGIRYTVPDAGHRGQTLQVAMSALDQSLDAYDQRAKTIGVSVRRTLSALWIVGVGTTTTYDDVVQEGARHSYTLLALPLTVAFDSTALASPLQDPVRGLRVALNIAPTFSFGSPSTRFGIVQLTAAKFIDLGALFRSDTGRTVLALRALAGIARGAGAEDLPPDQRFYAGGSGTVRGYRYQSVGPAFPDGRPVGGTAMGAATAEMRQRFGAAWAAAVFIDGGEVSESAQPWSGTVRLGGGIGARYYTPIGPVRLDLALPMRRQAGEDRFEVYVGLGQAF